MKTVTEKNKDNSLGKALVDALIEKGLLKSPADIYYLQEADIEELIDRRPSYMDFIMTGTILPEGLVPKTQNIYQLVLEKEERKL